MHKNYQELDDDLQSKDSHVIPSDSQSLVTLSKIRINSGINLFKKDKPQKCSSFKYYINEVVTKSNKEKSNFASSKAQIYN